MSSLPANIPLYQLLWSFLGGAFGKGLTFDFLVRGGGEGLCFFLGLSIFSAER